MFGYRSGVSEAIVSAAAGDPAAMEGAFADPPAEAARGFRALLEAMARPGRVHAVAAARPPAPLPPAAGAAAPAPCDAETPVRLAPELRIEPVEDWPRFRRECPSAAPEDAAFAFGPPEAAAPARLPEGEADRPDRSATLVPLVPTLTEGPALRLGGPGVDGNGEAAARPRAGRGGGAARAEPEGLSPGAGPDPLRGRRPRRAAPIHPHRGGGPNHACGGQGRGSGRSGSPTPWLAEERRGDPAAPQRSVAQVREQMAPALNRVMADESLFERDLAALAVKQARGDLIEAVSLVRAYRTTLPRFAHSRPVDTGRMACIRRISATFEDAPGGQVPGPTFDCAHRLIDFALAAGGEAPAAPTAAPLGAKTRRIAEILGREGPLQPEPAPETDPTPPDLTREPPVSPANRAVGLQAPARGDEGFMLSLGRSTQRGYWRNHPFVGEPRVGLVAVEVEIPEFGLTIEIEPTECGTVDRFAGSKSEPPQVARGYGPTLGHA